MGASNATAAAMTNQTTARWTDMENAAQADRLKDIYSGRLSAQVLQNNKTVNDEVTAGGEGGASRQGEGGLC